ncbi:beta-lactamase [Fischerella sp. NIES-4106]|nr:beta-lactamase [Fischerella sp. NIES-4106]
MGNVTPQIGWYVGYLQRGNNVYFFATNIDIRNKKDPSARLELTRRCFKDLAVL